MSAFRSRIIIGRLVESAGYVMLVAGFVGTCALPLGLFLDIPDSFMLLSITGPLLFIPISPVFIYGGREYGSDRPPGVCPQCGYSLLRLPTASCPECGWGRES